MSDILTKQLASVDSFVENEAIRCILRVHQCMSSLKDILLSLRQVPEESMPKNISDMIARLESTLTYKEKIEVFLSGDVTITLSQDDELVSGGFKNFLKQYEQGITQLTSDLFLATSSLVAETIIPQGSLTLLEESMHYSTVHSTHSNGSWNGAFSTVIFASFGTFSSVYTVKRYSSNISCGNCQTHFRRDFKKLCSLRHSGWVPFHAYFLSNKDQCINTVNDFVHNTPLSFHIQAQSPPNDLLIIRWLEQSISVLSFLHSRGFVHANLHGQNILIDVTSNVKITGMETTLLAKYSSVLSKHWRSSPYASFERSTGLPWDSREDVWALGCIWTELVMRRKLEDLLYPATGQLCSVSSSVRDCLRLKVKEATASKSLALSNAIFSALKDTNERPYIDAIMEVVLLMYLFTIYYCLMNYIANCLIIK